MAWFRLGCASVLCGLLACGGDSDPERASADAALSTDDAGGDAGAAPDEAPMEGLLIKLDDGELQGDMAGESRRFLNIPYAKPPLGALRWKAPVPNEPWSGVRHETEFVKGCPQLADQGAPASDNEDCLYLNVWAPNPAPRRAPVMIWIHGGGNFSGGTGIPIPSTDKLWYDGQFFASKQGVVLVSLQYRLGPLGFFAHPALGAEGGAVGNQGLLDQRLAFQWVKKNIARFGGDPDNVTIFGESAGSADVCYHVASPGSRGLFHRAISQSGGCTIRSVGPEQAVDKIAAQMTAYAAAVGCPEGDAQLSCMRQKPVSELLANAMQPMPGAGGTLTGNKWSFAAVLDGASGVLPDTPQNLFDQGKIADVPYLLGANNDEGTTFVLRATPLTNEAEYMADLSMRFGAAAADVAALYPPSAFGGNFNAARARVIGDSGVVCSTHDTARRAAKAGRKVFLYNFNVRWSIAADALMAGHAAELSHVFGAPYLPQPDPASEQVGQDMNRYWAQFARSGDPNGPSAPALWPSFSVAADKRLELAPGFAVLDDFRSRECAFWRKFLGVE